MAANEPGQPGGLNHKALDEFSRNLATPQKALAIGAHPDDVEFGCGGTLAKWAAAGCTVHHVVCTDGSKGTWNPDADVAELAATRQVEQRAAARRLAGTNAGEVRFLGVVDGELENTRELRGRVAAIIRELQPDVVLGHDPWKRYRLHPDHRNAGLIACDAIVAARDPHFFKEHEHPHHRPDSLLLWEADQPDHVEDVSSAIDAKLSALAAHESQFESTMKTTESDLSAFDDRIRARLAGLGEPHGFAAAEVFKLIPDL
ncbi:MAG: PIG-L deacetylase family protein [Actinomycetota bacterium]